MRIISNFKDYYDYIQKFGSDPNVVYTRKLEYFGKLSPLDKIQNLLLYNKDDRFEYRRYKYGGGEFVCVDRPTHIKKAEDDLYYRTYSIYFCGKEYSFAQLFSFKKDGKFAYQIDHNEIITRDEFDTRYNIHKPKYSTPYNETFKQLKKELALSEEYPILYLHSYYLELKPKPSYIVNFKLDDLSFYKFFPAQQAFQMIAQFLSERKEITNSKYKGQPVTGLVSDKDLAQAKGFDKYSFRKDKQK